MWWRKDKGGRRQALCLYITKVMAKLYAGGFSKRTANSTLAKR
jgi:hypothetical protein